MKRLFVAGAMLGIAAGSFAQVIDDFEHNNLGLYTNLSGGVNNFTITGAAAHGGALGASFTGAGGPAFFGDTSTSTSPGFIYTAMVRSTAASGRIYLGVGASAGGAFSAVFAPNTGEVSLQDNTGWGFTTLASAPAAIAANTWYTLQMTWAANGDMTASLYDEPGTGLIAATSTVATGNTTAGFYSFRGFTDSGDIHMDDVTQVVPEPATLAVLGIGLAFLARRKRSR
ncbi:MAG: PEP-CTERM sorting domain-containing protein [Armatimonadota bacterium]|nr:PEP-CTERM sorting domain-containing protein [Armatimonadota bacterium]